MLSVKKRMLASILAMAMIFSLFSGIAAYAKGESQTGERSLRVAIMHEIEDPWFMDLTDDSMDVVPGEEDILFFALVEHQGDENYEKLKKSDIDKLSFAKVEGDKLVDAKDKVSFEQYSYYDSDQKITVEPEGFFNVTVREFGEYRIYYKNDSYVTLDAKLPTVGIYSSDKISEDSFICSANREASFSFDDSSEYYLLVDMTDLYSATLKRATVYTWVNGKKKDLDKDDYLTKEDDSKVKIKFPAGKDLDYDSIDFEFDYMFDDGQEWRDCYAIGFKADREGFAIAGVDWPYGQELPSFAEKDKFGKNINAEIPGDTFISLGWNENDEVSPLVLKPEDIKISDWIGRDVSAEISISNKMDRGGEEVQLPDGVYRINATNIDNYHISIDKDGATPTVRIKTGLPKVGVYKDESGSLDSLVCGFGDELEYSPQEKYYLVANNECKSDKNLKHIYVKENQPFAQEEEVDWDFSNPYPIEIPSNAEGWYESAVQIRLVYGDSMDNTELRYLDLKERPGGMLIADADWEDGVPEVTSDIDRYGRSIDYEMGDIKYVGMAYIEDQTVNYIRDNEIRSFEICESDGTPITDESVASVTDRYTDSHGEDVSIDYGLFGIKINDSGEYKLRIKYQKKNTEDVKTFEYKIASHLPDLALYKTGYMSEGDIFAKISKPVQIDRNATYETYLLNNWSEEEMAGIQCIDLIPDSGIEVDKPHIDNSDLKTNLSKVTINKTNVQLKLKVKITYSDGTSREYCFYFIPKPEGLVVSHADGDEFNEDINAYSMSVSLDANVWAHLSFGITDGDKVTPVKAENVGKFELKYADGEKVDENDWTISILFDGDTPSGKYDGIFNLWVRNPGVYSFCYDDECVTVIVNYPDVAFTLEEGTTYNPFDDSTKMISDDAFDDDLLDKYGDLPVFEKDFYIGSYTYPETVEGDERREVIIEGITPVYKGTPKTDLKNIKCETSEDKHTAKIYANMNAIKELDSTKDEKVVVQFKVDYSVKYYHKDGETWKEDRREPEAGTYEKWFNINLLKDDRVEIDPEDTNVISWPAEEELEIEYDGTEKTIELTKVPEFVIIDDKTEPVVDVAYTDNTKTDIGSYTAKATLTIKDEYKTMYKFVGETFDSAVVETNWKIVKPQAVIDLETYIENSIPTKAEDITTDDPKAATAVVNAKAMYDKLSDVQKKVVSADAIAKLTKADTALKNYSDAVDKINGLPDTVDLSDEAYIKAAREAYDKLTEAQKKVADDEYDATEKLESSEKALEKKKAEKKEAADKKAADDVVSKITKLPNNAGAADEAAVKAARDAYDALTEDQKKLVDASILKKLTNAEESVAKAKKAAEEDEKKKEEDKKNPKYSNEWIDGKWYNADGTQDYPGTLQWKSNATGWWVEDTSGWYPTDQWQKIDGKWYYFTADGYMDYSEYRDGCWLGADGAWDENYAGGHWMSDSSGWWYTDNSGWYPKSQWLWIDGVQYYFDASGYMV